jgi:catechol 2,3-dioxygenase-like lactoylglutathione lyase family enzyme
MPRWVGRVSAITLFVEDLAAAKRFYQEVFELPVHFEDPHSAVFDLGSILVNLLTVSEAPELIEPARVADASAGSRFQLTIPVDDVDAIAARLVERGVTLLNGPMDRPWGVRTAAFADPAGHVWEIAH